MLTIRGSLFLLCAVLMSAMDMNPKHMDAGGTDTIAPALVTPTILDGLAVNETMNHDAAMIDTETATPSGTKRADDHHSIGEPCVAGDRLARNLTATTIADPRVHDWIELTDVEKKIIDHPAMQRLRRIQQLSGVSMVWPSANHDRFIHSLGVMHLAKKIVESINKKQPGMITDREAELVAIAGLMHDVGHGPWSHLWDITTGDDHERRSCEIVRMILSDREQIGTDFTADDILFVQSLIKPDLQSGNHQDTAKVQAWRTRRGFLYEIVANEYCQLDVDKMDYLMRDAEATDIGIKLKGNIERLIRGARVSVHKPTGLHHIAYPHKTLLNVSEIFQCRYKMHTQVYKHKTVVAFATMIGEAVQLANPMLNFTERSHACGDAFLSLTDENILEEIKRVAREIKHSSVVIPEDELSGDQRDLLKAADLLQRLDQRKLYKPLLAGAKMQNFGKGEQKDMRMKALGVAVGKALGVAPGNFLVTVTKNGLGGKFENVMFYSSDTPDECSTCERTEVSHVETFPLIEEVVVQVYVVDAELAKEEDFMQRARIAAQNAVREA